MRYSIKDFLPLLLLFTVIVLFTSVRQWYHCCNLMQAMTDFMGAFFILFGFFKIINLAGFVEAYRIYDILAQRFVWYGYVYPFIEVSLGVAYLVYGSSLVLNLVTFVIMAISSIGVTQELRKGKEILCACLGAVFKIPMTYVTLAEDLLMAVMALAMIILDRMY